MHTHRSLKLYLRTVGPVLMVLFTLTACGRQFAPQSGGSGSPGQAVPGSRGNPRAPIGDGGPADPRICGQTIIGPGAGLDTAVGWSICPGDTDPHQPPQAQPVTPRPGMAGVRPIPWQRVDVGSDDRNLTLTFASGIEPCSVLDHVDVRYGSDRVTVTLFEGHDPDAGDVACIEIAVFKSVTVLLDQALDGRKIVDGAPH